MNRLLHTLGALITVALVACSGSDSPPVASGPLPVEAAVLAQIPVPLAPDMAQAPGTFVGEVGPNPAAYVGFVVQRDYVLVYLCDGIDGEWLGTQIKDGEIHVVSAAGTAFNATVTAEVIEGTVTAPAWATRAFRAKPPTAGNGIFVGADPTLPEYTRRWLVLPDGVRGVSKIKATSKLVNVGAVNGVSTGPGALAVKAPVVTGKIFDQVVAPPPSTAPPNQKPPLPALSPVTQAEIDASGVRWLSFRPGDCYALGTGQNQTCLSASDWPPQCRSLSLDRIVCPDPEYTTATLPPITQAEIDASGMPWINYGPGNCYVTTGRRFEECLSPSDWPPQCRSLSVGRIVCPDERFVTATLPPVTQAEINGSGLAWSTFGPGQCFTENAGLPATCLRASDWPPQCRSLSALSIACPKITAVLPPVTQAEIDASGAPWIRYTPDDCYYPRTGRGQTCMRASDWPPQCRSLSADSIACPDPRYATATLPPITRAEIDASGMPWLDYGPGNCYVTTGRRVEECLSASDWPPQCRSLSVGRIVCPNAELVMAALPPITQAEINASGVVWINFRPGNCYVTTGRRFEECLSPSDWPPQCRSLAIDRIVCPDASISVPPPAPVIAGGKKLDCDTLAKLLLSITKTGNLKDEAVQKEIAALQGQQKLNGCVK